MNVGIIFSRGNTVPILLSIHFSFPWEDTKRAAQLGRNNLFRYGVEKNFCPPRGSRRLRAAPARAPEKIGLGRLMGFERQRVEFKPRSEHNHRFTRSTREIGKQPLFSQGASSPNIFQEKRISISYAIWRQYSHEHKAARGCARSSRLTVLALLPVPPAAAGPSAGRACDLSIVRDAGGTRFSAP